MKQVPEVGSRVRYTGPSEMFKGATGVVTRIFYPCDDEGISVGVEVDGDLPEYWPYLNSRRFAPDLEEVDQV